MIMCHGLLTEGKTHSRTSFLIPRTLSPLLFMWLASASASRISSMVSVSAMVSLNFSSTLAYLCSKLWASPSYYIMSPAYGAQRPVNNHHVLLWLPESPRGYLPTEVSPIKPWGRQSKCKEMRAGKKLGNCCPLRHPLFNSASANERVCNLLLWNNEKQ